MSLFSLFLAKKSKTDPLFAPEWWTLYVKKVKFVGQVSDKYKFKLLYNFYIICDVQILNLPSAQRDSVT